MKKPDLSKCTEEELWKYVGYHLSYAEIESVLVGGAVVAIYSNGSYHSAISLLSPARELDRRYKRCSKA